MIDLATSQLYSRSMYAGPRPGSAAAVVRPLAVFVSAMSKSEQQVFDEHPRKCSRRSRFSGGTDILEGKIKPPTRSLIEAGGFIYEIGSGGRI